MGLQLEYVEFILDSLALTLPETGFRMCELGNQHIRPSARAIPCVGSATTGKELFQQLGFEHVSIDLNGLDGALAFDLADPSTAQRFVPFDIVTNSGTSEHVTDQYACFQNIHDLTLPGGIMVHLSPEVGHWKGHGLWHYAGNFFWRLGELCRYEWLRLDRVQSMAKGPGHDLIGAVMRKTAHSVWPMRVEFERTLGSLLYSVESTPLSSPRLG